jgi:hypothetical protein
VLLINHEKEEIHKYENIPLIPCPVGGTSTKRKKERERERKRKKVKR